MRQIGTLSEESSAERFVDYLTTLGIAAQSEADDGKWLVWIRDENQIEAAREELSKFQANPGAEPYQAARQRAYEIRSEEAKKRMEATKQFHQVRDVWSAPLSKKAPIVFALIVICIALAVMGGGSVFASSFGVVDHYLRFADFRAFEATGDAFVSIKAGQIWRVFTPALLHGSLMHLAFNLYWIYLLGTQIESKIGRLKFLGLTLAGAALPNILQAFLDGPNFLGISGVVFAYFGYVMVRRNDGYLLSQFTIILILGMFLLDFISYRTGAGNTAIWCHAGGLAVGVLMGYYPDWIAASRRP